MATTAEQARLNPQLQPQNQPGGIHHSSSTTMPTSTSDQHVPTQGAVGYQGGTQGHQGLVSGYQGQQGVMAGHQGQPGVMAGHQGATLAPQHAYGTRETEMESLTPRPVGTPAGGVQANSQALATAIPFTMPAAYQSNQGYQQGFQQNQPLQNQPLMAKQAGAMPSTGYGNDPYDVQKPGYPGMQAPFSGAYNKIGDQKHTDDPYQSVGIDLNTWDKQRYAARDEYAGRRRWGRHFIRWPMFWAEYNTDSHVARFSSLFSLFVAIIAIVFIWQDKGSVWPYILISALLADYVGRFVAGERASVTGILGSICASPFPRNLHPTAPHQFANFLSMLFALGATIAVWSNKGSTGATIAATVFLGLIIFHTLLHVLFKFLLGAWLFHLFVKCGCFSPLGLRRAERTEEEQYGMMSEIDRRSGKPRPVPVSRNHDNVRDRVQLRYRPKDDDVRREDFHLIRHMRIQYFVMPMALAAFATIFKITRDPSSIGTSHDVANVFAYIAGIVFGIMLVLYLLKLLLHRRKVHMEWMDPVRRNYFSAITLTLALLAFLASPAFFDGQSTGRNRFSYVLWWAAAPLQAVIVFATISLWVKYLNGYHTQLPHMMLPFLSCLAIAFAAPYVNLDYSEAAWFWFSIGVIWWMITFTLSFQRGMVGAPILMHHRHGFAYWLAAPALITIAWVAMFQLPLFDSFARFFFYFTLAMVAYLFIKGFVYAYMGRNRWNMDYWELAFAVNIAAVACAYYHISSQNKSSEAFIYIAIVTAIIFTLLNTMHFLLALCKRTIFNGEERWGPLEHMRVTHYTLRAMIDELVRLSKFASQDKSEQERFLSLFPTFALVYHEHSKHEDQVIFPAITHYFPRHPEVYTAVQEHERDHRAIGNIMHSIAQLRDMETRGEVNEERRMQMLNQMHPMMGELGRNVNTHLDLSDLHIAPIYSKYMPLDMQRNLTRKIWDITPVEKWRVIMPVVLQNQPIHRRRVSYLHCFLWAVPEQAHLIGSFLYEGVDRLLFERLAVDVPEMVPRHVEGYNYYV